MQCSFSREYVCKKKQKKIEEYVLASLGFINSAIYWTHKNSHMAASDNWVISIINTTLYG